MSLEHSRAIYAAFPSHGSAFTQLTLDAMQVLLGEPAPFGVLHSSALGGKLYSPHLGLLGRFGNQLLQYGFCRLLAKLSNVEYVFPAWSGALIFQDALCRFHTPSAPPESQVIDVDSLSPLHLMNMLKSSCAVSISGYFGLYPKEFEPLKGSWREFFNYRPEILSHLKESAKMDALRPGEYIVAHIRQGDFVGNPKFETRIDLYIEALNEVCRNFPSMGVLIVSDDPLVIERLGKSLSTTALIPSPFLLRDLQFLYDHYLIRNAGVVLASPNSTFSMTGAMLNSAIQHVYLPSADGLRMVNSWSFE